MVKTKCKLNQISNYAAKSNLKNAAGADTSKFAKKIDLASSKSDVNDADIDELNTAPTDLNKLSNALDNDVVKKDVFYKLF